MSHFLHYVPAMRFVRMLWPLAALVLVGSGCRTILPHETVVLHRPFSFQTDTFAFPNELVVEHAYDRNGKWQRIKWEPKPTYHEHCLVLSRSALQFYRYARFAPEQPRLREGAYRELIHRIVSINIHRVPMGAEFVTVPGYSDLRSFSREHETSLKNECGGMRESYLARGNHRMVAPFTRAQQEEFALRLLEKMRQRQPMLVHMVRFPHFSINHFIVVYDARRVGRDIQFSAYDPNDPSAPAIIVYRASLRSFTMRSNDYFPGGHLDLYEVRHGWIL